MELSQWNKSQLPLKIWTWMGPDLLVVMIMAANINWFIYLWKAQNSHHICDKKSLQGAIRPAWEQTQTAPGRCSQTFASALQARTVPTVGKPGPKKEPSFWSGLDWSLQSFGQPEQVDGEHSTAEVTIYIRMAASGFRVHGEMEYQVASTHSIPGCFFQAFAEVIRWHPFDHGPSELGDFGVLIPVESGYFCVKEKVPNSKEDNLFKKKECRRYNLTFHFPEDYKRMYSWAFLLQTTLQRTHVPGLS